MSDQQQPSSVIAIKTKFFPLALLLLLFKPRYSINGSAPAPAPWGTTQVPVPPGRYQVEVWLPYLFFPQMGRNGSVVDLAAGSAVQVTWTCPWLFFLKGRMKVSEPTAAAGASAPAPSAATAPPPPPPA
ncbi:MAG: hypothetical protein JWN46_55 [Acidimicrobiales bacterium]|nr:hypothetical protein [Acidimicrobiales bacterium]